MYSPRHVTSLWRIGHSLPAALQVQQQSCSPAGLLKCLYWTQSSLQAGAELREGGHRIESPIGTIKSHGVEDSFTNAMKNQQRTVFNVITVQRESQELRKAIQQTKDPLSALELTLKNLNVNSATVCLQQILMLCIATEEADISQVCDEILIDSRFLNLSNYIHRKVEHLSFGELLNCFRSIIMLTPKDIYLCESLGTQILFSLRKMPMSLVVKILEILKTHRETDLRQKLYHETLATVDKRWVELSNPKELLKLMYMYSGNENSFYGKLEERALDLTEKMSPKSLYRVLYLLSKRRSRNTPLIRSVVYHLNKAKLELDVVHLRNILYACSTLNVYDQDLLTKLMSDIKSKVSQTENHLIATSVLMSCSTLRWRDTDVLKVIFSSLEKQFDQLSKEDCTLIITTLARLNIDQTLYAEFLKHILEKLVDASLKENDPASWLDVVWSLGILSGVDEQRLSSVLDPKFVDALPAIFEKDTHRLLASHVKVLNLEAVANLDIHDYTGPHLPTEWHSTATPSYTRAHRNLAESIVLALSNMAPVGKYLKTDVVSKYGYFIDAELYVNQKGSPVPYEDGTANPAEHKRIAIKVLDFYDMTLPKPAPLVIMVPYHEWTLLPTVVKKVQYLRRG
ncbi:hypothetical protein ScPMuIL_011967 [Solemya velum]